MTSISSLVNPIQILSPHKAPVTLWLAWLLKHSISGWFCEVIANLMKWTVLRLTHIWYNHAPLLWHCFHQRCWRNQFSFPALQPRRPGVPAHSGVQRPHYRSLRLHRRLKLDWTYKQDNHTGISCNIFTVEPAYYGHLGTSHYIVSWSWFYRSAYTIN